MNQTNPDDLKQENNLLPEYNFDYSQAKKNRFSKLNQKQFIVTIDSIIDEVMGDRASECI